VFVPELTRAWRPGRPVDLHATLGSLRHGSGDPAYRTDRQGAIWRASRTPDGPGTVRLAISPADAAVTAAAWGPGAAWLIESLPALLGEDDDPAGFLPCHEIVRQSARRYRGWRVPTTALVMESLVPAILEQKVTGREASRSWRELLWRFGDHAPGPDVMPRAMRVIPAPRTWVQIPSWEWHRAGVDGGRVRAIRSAAAVAGRLEETVRLGLAEAERRLRLIPGVGVWTSAEVRQRAHGDADAVSIGDFHLSGMVGWALTGRKVDDAGMLELLEPYAGHRYRAVRMIELAGLGPPRRGPRFAQRDYRAM
jgi:3-methyladenine DNA glycosylase/8-oxoguanine DNA glycosylase